LRSIEEETQGASRFRDFNSQESVAIIVVRYSLLSIEQNGIVDVTDMRSRAMYRRSARELIAARVLQRSLHIFSCSMLTERLTIIDTVIVTVTHGQRTNAEKTAGSTRASARAIIHTPRYSFDYSLSAYRLHVPASSVVD